MDTVVHKHAFSSRVDVFDALVTCKTLNQTAQLAALICDSQAADVRVDLPGGARERGHYGDAETHSAQIEVWLAERFLNQTEAFFSGRIQGRERAGLIGFSGVPILSSQGKNVGYLCVFHEPGSELLFRHRRALGLLAQLVLPMGASPPMMEGSRLQRSRMRAVRHALKRRMQHKVLMSLGSQVARTCHELKSPLSSMVLELGILRSRLPLNESSRLRVGRLLQAVERIHRALDTLFDSAQEVSSMPQRRDKKNRAEES